jgi:toxin FitB
MGTTYIIDTSAYSKFISELLSEENANLMQIALETRPIISVITRIELLSWRTTDTSVKTLVNDFIAQSEVLGLTEPVILQTIRIRRQHRVKLPDVIIAATAIVNGFTLLSTNDSDFEKINGLAYKSLNQ